MAIMERFRLTGAVLTVISLIMISGCTRQVHTQTPAFTPSGSEQAEVNTEVATVRAEPEWFACVKDEDCMAVEGVCGAEAAVNKLFRGQFVAYRNAMNEQSNCKAAPTISNLDTPVGCLKSRCVVRPQKLRQEGTPGTDWPRDQPGLHPYGKSSGME